MSSTSSRHPPAKHPCGVYQVGIYGGSFDPIHVGHVQLAVALLERAALDLVIFVPAFVSPHKSTTNSSPEHRIHMVRLAIEDLGPQFRVSDCDVRKSSPSYTIDLLREMHAELTREFAPCRVQLSLLLGSDSLVSFPRWREPRAICSLARLVVGLRETASTVDPHYADTNTLKTSASTLHAPWIEELGATVLQYNTPQFDVSATLVRERLARGLPCAGVYLDRRVCDYIYEHQLYRAQRPTLAIMDRQCTTIPTAKL